MTPSAPPSTRERGALVEATVADLLDRHGLAVIARNVAIAGAEIDLIATTENTLESREPLIVFVEVRSRADDRLGHPLETVDATKRRKIVRAAKAWLVRENLWEKVAVRFDVIGVLTGDGGDPPSGAERREESVSWIRCAFDSLG